jgi:hypothetical protein
MLFLSTIIRWAKSALVPGFLLALSLLVIVGGIAFGFYKNAKAKAKILRQTGLRDQVELIVGSVEAHLRNPETCSEALKGFVLKPGAGAVPTLNFTYDPDVTQSQNTMTEDSEISPGILLHKLSVESDAVPDLRTQIGDMNDRKYTPIFLQRYSARLQMEFTTTEGQPISTQGVTHRRADGSQDFSSGIPLFVWVDADNQVQSCFGPESAGTLCNEFGGYFVPGLKDYQKSCRQSVYTEKIEPDGKVKSIGSCRTGGFVAKAADCNNRFGGGFMKAQALWTQQADMHFLPSGPKMGYLCLLCY